MSFDTSTPLETTGGAGAAARLSRRFLVDRTGPVRYINHGWGEGSEANYLRRVRNVLRARWCRGRPVFGTRVARGATGADGDAGFGCGPLRTNFVKRK